MALSIIKQVTGLRYCALLNKNMRRFYSLYEPDYLEVGKSDIPQYPVLNIQVKGYKYSLLEAYQAYVHKLANTMDFDIDNSWALPPQKFKIQRYKPRSTIVDTEYFLNLYERNIQISDISTTFCPILVRILEAALPEGVFLKIHIYDPDYENKRYIPDKELLDLKITLQDLRTKRQ